MLVNYRASRILKLCQLIVCNIILLTHASTDSKDGLSGNHEKGIDVSRWDGPINWKNVSDSGTKHVFIKMTEGGTHTDPEFVENWRGATEAGIKVNCYHYFRGLSSTPDHQLANIKTNLNAVNFNPSINKLAIDVEEEGNENVTPQEMADNLNSLLEKLKNDGILSGHLPVIYCSSSYWDNKVQWSKYDFSIYPLWISHWNVDTPRIPSSWKNAGKTWIWWQYSDKGNLDGINGDVHMNWVKL